ncbi:cytochrome P450 [Limtongia smithiae]|uniref:cytochrome P450 n=1 Tax=Limtongia smithiae TaxID=1125753 RepID=UPI0034CDF308
MALLLVAYYVCLAVVSSAIVVLLLDIRKWLRMPPGPLPLPFLGNKLSLPASKPWVQFEQWARIYGPIFTIWIGRRPTVIISDPTVAVELMEKRSAKYSSRPRFVAMGELFSDMSSILVQPYGKKWSMYRKLLHQGLTPSALRLYKPVQTAEASRLCYQLLCNPGDWEMLLDRFTAGIVFVVSYGHRIDSMDAKVIRKQFEVMQYMASLNVPGAYLVESLPFLKYLPTVIAPWKQEIIDHGLEQARESINLLNSVRRDIANAEATGTPIQESLAKLLLETRASAAPGMNEREFASIPLSLFGAGSDTTASTLCSAFLALVTHPEALRAAQAELDAVVGSERSPTYEDEPRLPYLKALIKEVLRWRPVAVLGGTPHASTEDDYYEGFYIPAGTTVLGNTWAINLNEEYYPNPHHFNPKRFLGDEGALASEKSDMERGRKTHPAKSGHSSFGWGRRICPGADIAMNNLVIALGKLLWAFDILAIPGYKYDIFAYTEGFNIRPLHFECVIKPRSEKHRQVVEAEYMEAMEVMARFPPFE